MWKLYILLGTIFIFLTGCKDGNILPYGSEIDNLDFVRAIALDKGDSSDTIKVTVTSKRETPDRGGETSSSSVGKTKAKILTSEAESVFTAERNFQSYTEKKLTYGHANFFLIGESAAKDDITKYIDFITRDHEMRLTSLVYLVQGDASDILKTDNSLKDFLPDRLENLTNSIKSLSISTQMEIYQLEGQLDDNQTVAIAVPSINILQKDDNTQNSLSEPSKDIELNGYGIIKNFKLKGFIHDSMARAYNIIINKVGSGTIDVNDQNGNLVSMEILGAKTKLILKVEGRHLRGVTISTEFNTNIDETHGKNNIFKENSIEYLEHQQSDIIKTEIESLVKYAKENDVDFLKIGQAIMLKRPIIWGNIKDKWDKIFPTLDIDVQVESRIMRSYDIREPSGYKKGEKQ